jgi:putative holliday junction resolvase
MRILAVDYGLARIGLALSDPTGLLAQGLTVLKRQSDAWAATEITTLAQQYEVDEIVVGHPVHMNGSRGEKAEHCERFAALVREHTSLPVMLFDERLTTVQAEKLLIASDMRRDKRKKVIDEVAATLLLQTYLDAKRFQR